MENKYGHRYSGITLRRACAELAEVLRVRNGAKTALREPQGTTE